MAKEKDMVLDVGDDESVNEYYLLAIIDNQMDTLYALDPLNFNELYDESIQDKIKCVAGCFRVVEEAQNALLKQIKK